MNAAFVQLLEGLSEICHTQCYRIADFNYRIF